MRLFKYITIGLMLISIALALDIRMPSNLTLSEGETKDIQINLSNNLNVHDTIGIIGYSDNSTLFVMPHSRTIEISASSSTNTSFSIGAQAAKGGTYKVTFLFSSTEDGIVFSRSLTVTVREMLEIRPVYSFVKVTQGDFVTFKFMITNVGKSARSIIIDPESFPDEFNAIYPEPFYLNAGESKTVSIKVTIPPDYHSGVYSTTITVLSGEVKAESIPFDLSITKASAYKNVVNIAAVEVGGYIGNNSKGYNIMLRVENRKSEPITGIDVSGFPLGWNVSGDTPFSIDANTVKDINVRVVPKDFGEYTLDILLTKNEIVLTNTTITFSGAKAGLTGYAFLGGGSLTVGLLIIVIAVLVLLYVRQKNLQEGEIESKTEKAEYLKSLVDEAKEKEF